MENKYVLKWEDHQKHVTSTFVIMKENENFFDVTLMCEDNYRIQAHRVMLSTGSCFFREILQGINHPNPLIYLKGLKQQELNLLVAFIYEGKVDIALEDVKEFLDTAKDLKLFGLEQIETIALQTDISNKVSQETSVTKTAEYIQDIKEDHLEMKVTEAKTEQISYFRSDQTESENYILNTDTQNIVNVKNIIKTLPNYNRKKKMPSFPCDLCGKMFKDNFNKLRHMKLHIKGNLNLSNSPRISNHLASNPTDKTAQRLKGIWDSING